MIDCKKCETCEHFRLCDMDYGFCSKTKRGKFEEDVCEDWSPKHGEWILTQLCKPQDKEPVVIQQNGEIMLAKYSVDLRAFITDFGFSGTRQSMVSLWIRLPGRPTP